MSTADSVPFASAGHPTVFGVWLGEELAGKRDDGLCGVSARDPGAFRAGRRVVDDGAASVGRGGGCSGSLLGKLLCLAVRVPWEGIGLVIGIARVVGAGEGAAGEGECTTLERIEAGVGIVAGGSGCGSNGGNGVAVAGWSGMGMVVVVLRVWHPVLGGGRVGRVGRVGRRIGYR